MKKQIKDENIAEIMQIVIKVHGRHPELSFMQILNLAAGNDDLIDLLEMSDVTLLEELHKFYGTEIK